MNCYEVLEVMPGASKEVVKAAYRVLAQKYHPDKNSDPSAVDKMMEINKAYDEILKMKPAPKKENKSKEKKSGVNKLYQKRCKKYESLDEIDYFNKGIIIDTFV